MHPCFGDLVVVCSPVVYYVASCRYITVSQRVFWRIRQLQIAQGISYCFFPFFGGYIIMPDYESLQCPHQQLSRTHISCALCHPFSAGCRLSHWCIFAGKIFSGIIVDHIVAYPVAAFDRIGFKRGGRSLSLTQLFGVFHLPYIHLSLFHLLLSATCRFALHSYHDRKRLMHAHSYSNICTHMYCCSYIGDRWFLRVCIHTWFFWCFLFYSIISCCSLLISYTYMLNDMHCCRTSYSSIFPRCSSIFPRCSSWLINKNWYSMYTYGI